MFDHPPMGGLMGPLRGQSFRPLVAQRNVKLKTARKIFQFFQNDNNLSRITYPWQPLALGMLIYARTRV